MKTNSFGRCQFGPGTQFTIQTTTSTTFNVTKTSVSRSVIKTETVIPNILRNSHYEFSLKEITELVI